jgi:hypothetical protein
MAANCAQHAHERMLKSHRGTYLINEAPTARGQVICLYNNHPYKKPAINRREMETDLFRQRMRDAGIRELGYSTYPPPGDEDAGYSYAMILDAGESQLWDVRDAMRQAMYEAGERFESSIEAHEFAAARLEFLRRSRVSATETTARAAGEAITTQAPISVRETAQLRQVRVGQDDFRRAVCDNYGHQCCFPGCEVDHDALLVAAHIARWADDAETRGDIANGLCLCGLHDKAFESGLFTLTDTLSVVVNRHKARSSTWVGTDLQKAGGQTIRTGRILPSDSAICQHRDRHTTISDLKNHMANHKGENHE